jgi:hypothetical protein
LAAPLIRSILKCEFLLTGLFKHGIAQKASIASPTKK